MTEFVAPQSRGDFTWALLRIEHRLSSLSLSLTLFDPDSYKYSAVHRSTSLTSQVTIQDISELYVFDCATKSSALG